MGLRDGAEVEMIRSGSPCIVRVDDQRFCFRHDSLADVMVRIGATP
jgi:Fe2+ transport system protein FeoA